ncbi:MAG: hypothetical protein-putative related to sulfatases, partial [uncultured Phycisphaerae bacterium]
ESTAAHLLPPASPQAFRRRLRRARAARPACFQRPRRGCERRRRRVIPCPLASGATRQAGDLPLHARRPVPRRHVRLQAAPPAAPRPPAAVRQAAGAVRGDRRAARQPVEVRPARRVRRVGQRAVPRGGEARRRPHPRQVPPRLERGARRRAAQDQHRLRHVRPAQHGLVGQLRPGHREPQHARVHRDEPHDRARRGAELQRRVPPRRPPGHPPHRRPRRRADQLPRPPRRRRPAPPGRAGDARRGQPRAARDDGAGRRVGGEGRVVRARVPDADRSPGVARYRGRDGRDEDALRHRRRRDGSVRPPVPVGPPLRRGGRAVRPMHPRLLGLARQPQVRARQARPPGRPARRGSTDRPEVPRPARRDAGDLGRRVRPHADRPGRRRPRPQPPRLHLVARRRRHETRHDLRRHRRLRLLRRRGQGPRPRPPRHHPPPPRPRPRKAHLPLRRPGLPADRRGGHGRAGDPRL